MDDFNAACETMEKQFGHNVVLSLATGADNRVSVRTVNGVYKDGSIYVVTHMSTHKMKEVAINPNVAVCKDLFSAQGTGRNLGNPKDGCNRLLAKELRAVFAAFYDRHVNEDDPQTCILRIDLENAVVFDENAKYAMDFGNKTAKKSPFRNDIVYES